ncbi:hypothetical protein K2173_014720 [Erythroxylum novogranatense]|uniref:Serine hydrolase domain-containing protein n=1 Tax=Erythroxylum novogranatense TaxID=1862640 RepID=A0AAV8TFW5_9ROSI|nr:hypothetical protein K2173_014720 [Erythroxylum novogranatense]
MGTEEQKKPRVLCLHGFRTSGSIIQKLIGRFPESVLQRLDLVFLDGPFPAEGKSDVEGIYDPPYYEWFQSNEDFSAYRNFEACLEYIEDYMIRHGPFDGVLGFSQGAVLTASLPGIQRDGVGLTRIPAIKFVIIISGAKFGASKFGTPEMAATAFSTPIELPSLHFTGEKDFMKEEGKLLIESFVDPMVIHHSKGHTVPRLEGRNLEIMSSFIDKFHSREDE